MDATIIWDLEDDMDGNVQHLREHDVTIEEARIAGPAARLLEAPLRGYNEVSWQPGVPAITLESSRG